MKPRISVVVPIWNEEEHLDACLRSVLRQSEERWECILVDDGSTDRSVGIARRFEAADPRFRLLETAHTGIVPTLEAGAEACRAPLVARMDADDWMHRDRLRLQADALDGHPGLDAVGAFVRIFPRRELADGRRRYESWLNSLATPERIWIDRFIECPIAHPTLALRRRTLLELGYRDNGWPEDYDLLLRILRGGPRVGIVPRRLLGWRDHPARLSRSDPRYALDRFTACRAWHLSRDFLDGAPRYILWGHGRTGRALRRALSDLGHHAATIVDVHPRRIGNEIGGAPVIAPEALPEQPPYPIVVSVAGSGPRGEIRSALEGMRFQEGTRFVCAA
jgi:glycosyltransferase involved in cell wall biosynthesis